jgi:hypothetical protein
MEPGLSSKQREWHATSRPSGQAREHLNQQSAPTKIVDVDTIVDPSRVAPNAEMTA